MSEKAAAQEVKLSNTLTILDSPGVIFPDKVDHLEPVTIITSCIMNQQISRPLDAIMSIYGCCDQEQLRNILELPNFDNFDTFISLVARRFGKLKKRAIPDLNAAAKMLLKYWTSGKILYYTEPPSINDSISTAIAPQWKSKFNLDPLPEDELNMIQGLYIIDSLRSI
ncbi:hypothetical protein HZS_2502 [Henneguya salminicola]|nr:hypothetical protein HZS_2502 [Henneguya salminicola]